MLLDLIACRPVISNNGDMVDGLGFLGAARSYAEDRSCGMRALLVGAGGAGSAIALALVEAGVSELAVHDSETERRDALIGRLNGLGKAPVRAGTTDPSGFDFVANATPAGMKDGDPLPVDVTRLAPSAYCGCVITKPEISTFIAEARTRSAASPRPAPTCTGSSTRASWWISCSGPMADAKRLIHVKRIACIDCIGRGLERAWLT